MKTYDTRAMITYWLIGDHAKRIERDNANGGSELSKRVAYLESITPANVVDPVPSDSYPQHNTPDAALHATGTKRS